MSQLLDRPIWSALNSRHSTLAEGSGPAKRYIPSISLFTATRDDSEESLAALSNLVAAGEEALLVQAMPIALPSGFTTVFNASLVQMIADGPIPAVQDERVQQLGEADAADMFELAALTKPGPFTLRAQAFGGFWGIRANGRLIAMAGQRLKQPGLTELSGVCVHPEAQGEGLGRLMSLFVAGRIIDKGEKPYLHAYATNSMAIGLYESIGFRLRSEMTAAMVRRTQ